jgi:hypothetical protein
MEEKTGLKLKVRKTFHTGGVYGDDE